MRWEHPCDVSDGAAWMHQALGRELEEYEVPSLTQPEPRNHPGHVNSYI